MLKFGEAYVEQGQTYYEEKYKERLVRNLSKRAKEFGFQLTPCEPATALVSSEAAQDRGGQTNRRFIVTRIPKLLINHRLERETRRAPAFTEPIERENY
jgi:hypothetical protein